MSKVIKSIVASAVILFSCFSAAGHAKVINPTKGCGYEIFSAIETNTGNPVKLCLHSGNGTNQVTVFSGQKKLGTYDVSDVQYLHTTITGVLEKVQIAISVPKTRYTLTFNIASTGRKRGADLITFNGPNARDQVLFNSNSAKANLGFGNGYSLEDYGIERRGQDARKVSNIVRAPSM